MVTRQGRAAGWGAGCWEKPSLEACPIHGSHPTACLRPPRGPEKAGLGGRGCLKAEALIGEEGRASRRNTWATLGGSGAPPGLTYCLQVRVPGALRSLG